MVATDQPVQHRRRKIWIDGFQTKLLVHVLAYCMIYQAAVWASVALWNQFGKVINANVAEETSTNAVIPALLCAFVLAPVICLSALKLAHRIVGPLVPIRRCIQSITRGTPVEFVRLREGDFLEEVRDDINEMLEALEERGAITIHRSGTWRGNKNAMEQDTVTSPAPELTKVS
jgi:hypothetical protein